MSADPGVCRVTAERDQLPAMAFSATFYWDGMGAVARYMRPTTGTEPAPPDMHVACSLTHAAFQTQCQMPTGQYTRPSQTVGEMDPTRSSLPQAIDWKREAQGLIFCLDPGLLLTAAHDVTLGATGELVWARREEHDQSITLYVHPLLIVHVAYEPLHPDRVQIVPHFHPCDPLLHHITLVLKAAIEAEGVAGRLYAESLTNALAIHLLRRYATCRPPAAACTGGLSKSKLRRTTEYIDAHLENDVPLAELAAVAQTSLAHFVRLFRQATGQTPHQYVIMSRIERAKRLLTETEWPLIEIGHRVGFTDQSYFTAVFRKHVGTTPKGYRGDTQR
jgi:AraC-like DNA-binding protein